MYQGGRLLFADFIFDGYGSTKKDFMKQVSQTGLCCSIITCHDGEGYVVVLDSK